MSISIIPTNPGQNNFELFTSLPQYLYPKDSPKFRIPEIIPSEHLRESFLLVDGKKVMARASIYDNPFLQFQGKHALTIGNYECVDERNYADKLISHLLKIMRSWRETYVIGPMNGSTWENYRFHISDDNPLFFTEPYHHLYYNSHFRNAGFEPVAYYFSNIDSNMQFDNQEITNREKELKKNGLTIRPIDLANFEEEIGRIYDFNAIAFERNFLYTPIDKTSFLNKYIHTKKLIDPELTLLAEDFSGKLVGYYFCVQDFYNTNEKSLIVKTLARDPAPEWRGLGHVIGSVVYRNAIKSGYTSAIHSFVYDHGTSTKLSANFSGKNYKNYVLYGRKIA